MSKHAHPAASKVWPSRPDEERRIIVHLSDLIDGNPVDKHLDRLSRYIANRMQGYRIAQLVIGPSYCSALGCTIQETTKEGKRLHFVELDPLDVADSPRDCLRVIQRYCDQHLKRRLDIHTGEPLKAKPVKPDNGRGKEGKEKHREKHRNNNQGTKHAPQTHGGPQIFRFPATITVTPLQREPPATPASDVFDKLGEIVRHRRNRNRQRRGNRFSR